jgi:hypothetical protein
MGLNREMLARRLRDVDFRIVNEMQCDTMQATAHRGAADARRGVNAVSQPTDAGECAYYRVTYRIKTLLGPGAFSNPATQPIVVLVDLNSNGNYPYSRPESFVIGPTSPWSPHFHSGLSVCFEVPGRVWSADGRTTLGHLLQHLARLINFDERIDDQGYVGYNAAAMAYWRTSLSSGPITPQLTYPMLPSWYFGQALPPLPPPAATRVALVSAPRANAVVLQPPRQPGAGGTVGLTGT